MVKTFVKKYYTSCTTFTVSIDIWFYLFYSLLSWMSITVTKFYSSSLYLAFDMQTASRAHHSEKQKKTLYSAQSLCIISFASTVPQ